MSVVVVAVVQAVVVLVVWFDVTYPPAQIIVLLFESDVFLFYVMSTLFTRVRCRRVKIQKIIKRI